jgi:hypothetical protein
MVTRSYPAYSDQVRRSAVVKGELLYLHAGVPAE